VVDENQLSPNHLSLKLPPMAQVSTDQITDIILGRRQVFDFDTDSRIRHVANYLTARALFELLTRLDDESPEFSSQLSSILSESKTMSVTSLIGFHTGDVSPEDSDRDEPIQPENPKEYYLKLVFQNEDAAYYQFPLFPNLSESYVLGAARKRAGPVQHLQITLARPESLQTFIESCLSNPHFLRVEESTKDEFVRAPSNSI
jgi:hypothetical protein